MKGAYLQGTHLMDADLTGADLTETHPEDAKSLTRTILHNVKELTKEQLEACKAKGAIIDEAPITSPPPSPSPPSPFSQSSNVQVPSASSAQGSTSTLETGESSAPSSQQAPKP